MVANVSDDRRGTPDRAHLRSVLQSLMRRYLENNSESCYLQEHLQPKYIDGHVRTFCQYISYLPDGGDVLDWGCHHAPDSCLLRSLDPDRFRLHGCDFPEPECYASFHEYAGLDYRQLTDIVATPYTSSTFDVVIGSGVLEHVAMDYESLKELHRILKPGGVLIITYLPNWLSAKEWVRRVVWKRAFHSRLYGLAEARRLLKRSGFLPLMDTHAHRGALLAPLRFFGSTLTLVARKVHSM
jgi:2-polyprenyl-3-methyl-5-hydroxy-6-metoxy-1,4-benzoquinol methylase